jgi:phytoene dehydrogenase-like protein
VTERRAKLGDEQRHRRFYDFLDQLSERLWRITRTDIKMPMQGLDDVVRNGRAVGVSGLPLARYLRWTMADALQNYGVYHDRPLRKAISMLVEDTVHSTLDEALLLNSVLGMTIRRTGLGRPRGGMFGFWSTFEDHYTSMGGTVETGETVTSVTGTRGSFEIETQRNTYSAEQVVSTVLINLTKRLAPSVVGDRLDDDIELFRDHEGGAIIVFLGVPESEVADHELTHHQILPDYDEPLGDGNNMFVSVSAPGDDVSAPPGHRAVMLSTHCEIGPWQNLDTETYKRKKQAAGERLLSRARTVYPDLEADPVVYEVGTPKSYERFTNRPRGAIGGYRQTLEKRQPTGSPTGYRYRRILPRRRHDVAGTRNRRLCERQSHRDGTRPRTALTFTL